MEAQPQALRIVVTGAAGFIGSHTVEALVARGHEVMAVDDMSHPCGHPLPSEAIFLEADEASSEVHAALERFSPQVALHLAAKGGVAKALRDPSAHIVAVLSHTVGFLDHAFDSGCGRLVIASSGGASYGEPATLPAPETLSPAPRSAYGAEKCCEETYLATFAVRGAATLALRYGNVYGPRQDGTGEAGVVAISATHFAHGEPAVIYGDGGQTRDFVFVGDVVRANVAACEGTLTGAVNVGTGREGSIRQVVELLQAAYGNVAPIDYRDERGGEVRRVCLDTSYATRALGFTSLTSLDEGLHHTADYFRSKAAVAAAATA